MRNHPKPNEDPLRECMVVYCFTCPFLGCPGSYRGMTTIRLSKRISCHQQQGAILCHFKNEHHTRPTRDALLKCIEIAAKADKELRLQLKEALFTGKERLTLNIMDEVKNSPHISDAAIKTARQRIKYFQSASNQSKFSLNSNPFVVHQSTIPLNRHNYPTLKWDKIELFSIANIFAVFFKK